MVVPKTASHPICQVVHHDWDGLTRVKGAIAAAVGWVVGIPAEGCPATSYELCTWTHPKIYHLSGAILEGDPPRIDLGPWIDLIPLMAPNASFVPELNLERILNKIFFAWHHFGMDLLEGNRHRRMKRSARQKNFTFIKSKTWWNSQFKRFGCVTTIISDNPNRQSLKHWK